MIIKPSSGNSLVFQDEGGDTALTVGTTGNTTLAGTANALGTVATGNLSNNNIVMPRFKEISRFHYDGVTETTSTQQYLNINGTLYTSATPESTGDIIEVSWAFNMYNQSGYNGFGIQRSAATNFGSPTTQWSGGEHSYGQFGLQSSDGGEYHATAGSISFTCAGLTPDTTYYWRMLGINHSPQNGSCKWGNGTNQHTNGQGIHMTLKRWSIV
jgi:hypothetical protein